MSLYNSIEDLKATGSKGLAILIDPDKTEKSQLTKLVQISEENHIDFFFIGGSLLFSTKLDSTIGLIKSISSIPIILFPGENNQICDQADGILLLSLISGRNPDLLIGQHVVAAPRLRESMLEILPTGYLLVDCGNSTSASYMSNTTPIPREKAEIAACTAMAGEMLGLKVIFMDGGSGAHQTIDPEMIKKVRENVKLPIIIGGGIKSANEARMLYDAGADILVVGTACEKDPSIIAKICNEIRH